MSPKPDDEERSPPVYTCRKCGAKHGGVKSINLCADCYDKQ